MDSTRLTPADVLARVGPIPPRLVTAAELAAVLRTGESSVRQWARERPADFPRVRAGRRWLYDLDAVVAARAERPEGDG